MVDITIKLTGFKETTEHFATMPEKLSRAMQRGIEKTAYALQGAAKQHTPVKTGRLLNSIQVFLFPLLAQIVPLTDYAVYVHEGTRYMQGRPFLADGARDIEGDVTGYFNDEIEKALE